MSIFSVGFASTNTSRFAAVFGIHAGSTIGCSVMEVGFTTNPGGFVTRLGWGKPRQNNYPPTTSVTPQNEDTGSTTTAQSLIGLTYPSAAVVPFYMMKRFDIPSIVGAGKILTFPGQKTFLGPGEWIGLFNLNSSITFTVWVVLEE